MNRFQKPLTEREYEVASVAGDLLMKGSPEYRIALHCVHRGLTKPQTETLMYKLEHLGAINATTVDKVMGEFDSATRATPDRYKEGHNLQIKIHAQKAVLIAKGR